VGVVVVAQVQPNLVLVRQQIQLLAMVESMD
jgi:hypothetical protein